MFLYAKLLIYEFISFLNMHVTFTTEGCDFTFDFEKKKCIHSPMYTSSNFYFHIRTYSISINSV